MAYIHVGPDVALSSRPFFGSERAMPVGISGTCRASPTAGRGYTAHGAVQAPERNGTVKLDLSDIARNPGSYAEQPIAMTFREVEGMTLTAPVTGTIIASSTGRVLLLEGSVDTEIELACSRCGGTYRQPVHAEFQEDFVVQPPVPGGQALAIEEDEDEPDTRFFFPGTLDLNLDELLRQSILLALPVKPLCQDDCRGLCSRCGTNLNDARCACDDAGVNPQLAGLQQFFDKRKHG